MENFDVDHFMGHMKVDVKTPSSKSQQVPQTPSRIEQISLKFRIQVKCRHIVVATNNIVSLVRGHKFRKLPLEILYVPIRIFQRDDEALQKFLSMQFVREIIDAKIVADVIKEKWVEIRNKNENLSTFGGVFPLTVTIKLMSIVTVYERELPIMTETEDKMVPTSSSAMEKMVKRAGMEDIEANQSCVICMEEIGIEEKSVVLRMPCLHLFHEDCITQWLRTSHYCPICRFQMPTN